MKHKVNTIFGPPGTGKTRTLVDIAVEETKQVNRILCLSYTKAAAGEIGSRVDEKVVKTSTIHSLAYSALGVSKASVVDGKKLASFGDVCGIPFASQTTGDYEQQEGDEYVSVLAFARNRLMCPWEAYDHFGRPGQSDRYKMFITAYPQWKDTYGFIDFDDMLERLPTATTPAYPVVLLDEAQDCSPLQWRAFSSVAAKAERVYIAGDDDQAIYEWGGADPHGMADYSKATNSGYKVLAQSHRVPKSVLRLAKDTILTQMGKRVEKKFAPMENEGQVLRYGDLWDFDFHTLGKGDNTGMILVRDRWRMKEMQHELNHNNIAYSMNGAGPYENRFAHAIRAVKKLNNGDNISEHERQALINTGTPTTAKDATDKRLLPIATRRWEDCLVIPAYIREFYETANMFADYSTISLSTIHGAKGREADHVVVDLTLSNKVEQSLYLDRDAELRVMYVAITRAKEKLVLLGSNPLL